MSLYEQWIHAKEVEAQAKEDRRIIEDKMIEEFGVTDEKEGTENFEQKGFKIKVTKRFNRRVDSDMLQELAREHGLEDHLGNLFRWKPELNKRAWDSCEESITGPLARAIEVKPGRPTFNISTKEEK